MKQDSFKAGLTLGVCLGVAGYFLFGTDRGKQLRKELDQVWEDHPELKKKLPASFQSTSFEELIQEVMVEVSSGLSHLSDAAEVASTKKTKTKSPSKAGVIKKFKGV